MDWQTAKHPTLGDLRLRDTVDLGLSDYGFATVERITDVGNGLIEVQLMRPYVHTGDTSYGRYGGTEPSHAYVLSYIGIETVKLVGGPGKLANCTIVRREKEAK